ncbi:hypothetical protein XTPLMG728_3895 [Xanthomonas translucens pv. poae]|uniref:Transposase n=1 Tax=Xanthomonas graminis pv. poae TaxID=227946 RepID=A0A0M1QF68_9XANT|nr:hypothetical protein [Xanthomonas translucens]UKE61953.1 hypothetical protein KM539_20150 [Xanthomonas translucens pv. poae]CTP93509.1 hypothetical protein XTPLMG728_3895 [Xanthomonas translucens pv. poae]
MRLGVFDVARLILHADQTRGRRHTTLKGERRLGKQSRQHAQREAEPWLLMVCQQMAQVSAGQVVAIYRRWMQIELGGSAI